MENKVHFLTILCVLFLLLPILSGCSKGKALETIFPVLTIETTATTVPSYTPTPSKTQTFTPSNTFTPTIPVTPEPSQTLVSPSWAIVDHWPAANQVRVLFVDASGDVWSGGPAGLVHWNLKTGTPTIYTLDPSNPNASNVTSLAQTPDGALWVGTTEHGLYQFDGVHWQNFSVGNGLPGNFILNLAVDPNGKLWINMVMGENSSDRSDIFGQFINNHWLQTSNYDSVGKTLNAFAAAPNGEIWVSWEYQVGQTWDTTISAYQPEKNKYVTRFSFHGPLVTMAIAPNGTPWVVTYKYLWQFEDGKWVYYDSPWKDNSDPLNATAMAVDHNNAVWFSTSFTYNDNQWGCGNRTFYSEEWGVYRFKENAWTHFTTEDGLADNMTCALTVGPNGDVWVGTADKGISHFDGQQWKTYSVP